MKFAKGEVDIERLGLTESVLVRWGQIGLRALAHQNVKLARKWRSGKVKMTSGENKMRIKRRLALLYSADEIKRYWSNLEEKLANPALARLVLLAGGRSRAFMDALIVAPSVKILNAALKLDVYDRQIPKSDLFHILLSVDPTFSSIGFRYRLASELIKGRTAVTDLACGNLLPLRLLEEVSPEWLPENVVACDTTLDREIVKSCRDYARRLKKKKVRLDFRRKDLFKTLESLPEKSQDVILANGICSYLSRRELRRLIELATEKLKSGGKLMIDLQLKGWPMEQDIEVLGWGAEISLCTGLNDTLKTMEWATEGVALESGAYYISPRVKGSKNLFEVLFVMTSGHNCKEDQFATEWWLFYFAMCCIIGYMYAKEEERASCS